MAVTLSMSKANNHLDPVTTGEQVESSHQIVVLLVTLC